MTLWWWVGGVGGGVLLEHIALRSLGFDWSVQFYYFDSKFE